jgi:outer membrane protein assembly factor BamB
MRAIVLTLSIISVLLILGCSKSSPVDPSLPSDTSSDRQVIASGTVEIDIQCMTVRLVDDRNSALHLNVTSLLAGACPGGCFRWRITSLVGDVLTLELTLENPVNIQVYDARIVFTQLAGKTVTNNDGYVDVFSPNVWYPFIAFGKEFANRAFPIGPGGIDTEQMLLKWPNGASPMVAYFLEVSLGGNCGEPYWIHNKQQLGQLTPAGGNAQITMDVADHQNNVFEVLVNTSALTGNMIPLVHGSGDTWSSEISNTQHAPIGTYTCLIRASSLSETVKLYDYIVLTVAEPVSEAWTSFGGNARNSGNTPVIGPRTNHLLWFNDHKITGDYHTIGAPVIDSDGNVYYHVTPNPTDGVFYKVDGTDGDEMWSHDPDNDDGGVANKELSTTVPALDETNGYAYFACEGGIWAVNMTTGAHVGHYIMSSLNEGSSPTAAGGYVFCGYPGESMHAFNPTLATSHYAYTGGTGFSCAPAVDSSANAFFPSLGADRKFHGVNPSGIDLFTPKALDSQAERLVSAAIDTDGTVFYQTAGYKLYAFKPDGTIKWNWFNALNNNHYTSPAIGQDNHVFVFRQKALYAVNKTSGADDWNYVMSQNCMTPLIDGANIIYFLDYTGVFHAFDPSTKTFKWEYDTGRPLYNVPVYRYPSSAALGPDGLLVFMGNGGIWAIKDE